MSVERRPLDSESHPGAPRLATLLLLSQNFTVRQYRSLEIPRRIRSRPTCSPLLEVPCIGCRSHEIDFNMATLSVRTSHNDLRPQDATAVRSQSRSPSRGPPDSAGTGSGRPEKRHDQYVMDSNNSSIVSKRSVEKLYYAGEPEYFRHFVSKFKRRSPLINRGYWLRMKAVEHAVTRFLAEQTSKRKLVINLGCG